MMWRKIVALLWRLRTLYIYILGFREIEIRELPPFESKEVTPQFSHVDKTHHVEDSYEHAHIRGNRYRSTSHASRNVFIKFNSDHFIPDKIVQQMIKTCRN